MSKKKDLNKKMKTSMKKKKSKQNNKVKDSEVGVLKENLREKHEVIMREGGLDINAFCIRSVIPVGACGSYCTARHCHRDMKPGHYVWRNVYQYIVRFWPFSSHTQLHIH